MSDPSYQQFDPQVQKARDKHQLAHQRASVYALDLLQSLEIAVDLLVDAGLSPGSDGIPYQVETMQALIAKVKGEA